jgi:hypothetical protein
LHHVSTHFSQEVTLDIICRISHFYLQQDFKKYEDVTKYLPQEITKFFKNEGIVALLQDMRPFLREVNSSNPSIFSYEITSLKIGTTWKAVNTNRLVDKSGWLDYCKTEVCYNVQSTEGCLVRFPYSSIQNVKSSLVDTSIEVNTILVLLFGFVTPCMFIFIEIIIR